MTNLFGNNYENDDIEEINDKVLKSTLESVDSKGKEIEKPIVSEKSSTTGGGFSEGLSKFSETLAKMQENRAEGLKSPVEEHQEPDVKLQDQDITR